MYRKVKVSERLPEVGKFVTTIDEAGEHRVYRLTEHGWNMRDSDGDNSPNNNLPIIFWLEEIKEYELANARELLIAFHKWQQKMWTSPNAEITENVVDVFLKSN
jgi:hypothetical protein